MSDYYIHPTSIIDDEVIIGDNTRIWCFCHVQSGASIGNNCVLGQNVNISNNVVVGNNVKIQNNVSIYEGVELHDYVFCGPSCVFTNDLSPRSKYPKGKSNYKKTIVEEGASIGANATIVCGNTIGKYALIGAGAVVTKNVLPHALMVGVPALRKGWVCECGELLKQDLHCDKCGKIFFETDNGLEEIIDAV